MTSPNRSRSRSSIRERLVCLVAFCFLISIGLVLTWGVRGGTADNGGLKPSLSIPSLGTPITQNFDTLVTTGTTNTWTDDTTLTGWYSQFSLQPTNPTTYRADSGGSNTGAIYSWGVAGTNLLTERALGSVGSGTPGDIFNALKLTNNTGSTITSLTISYNGEQWRQGGCTPTPCTPASQKLDFQYQIANPGVITDANAPTTGWVDHDPLDFTSPQPGTSTAAAIDGNAAPNRTALSSTITVTINNGQEVWLRWKDINDANNDHGLAIDDFSVTANGTPTQTDPSGTGSANPNSVLQGASTLLTVNVTPGTNPASTALAVTADLTSIGGSASQSLSANGNTFTFNATVSNGTTPGAKSLPFLITDGQARSGSGSISLTVTAPPPTNNVVISQVYGGGGNTGATLTNDFIELVNHSSAPVNLGGWSVQALVSGSWVSTPLTNVTLQPGQYYLIQESLGAGGTDALPTPDAIGTIAVSSTSTTVALVNNTTLLSGACPDPGTFGIVDLVGYGTATCFEGAGAAPLLDNLTANFRRYEGCSDTNNNSADFVTGEPNPRNSSSPTHDCTGLFGFGTANPSSVVVGNNVVLTVTVSPAQNPASTGITVTGDLSLIGGSASQSFSGSGNVFTFTAPVPLNNTSGFKSLPITIADGQARSYPTNIVLSVLPAIADHITISQVYGGGGNSSATYTNDYVELYNPTGATVTITGWSLQYASATGSSWTNKQPLGGIIGPGNYYLVQLASGGAVGAPLPVSPNISGNINISATAGKIALVKNGDVLSGGCPLGSDPDIVDFVGYGSTASCHEGTANTPAPSNTTAILRNSNGAQDTDQNGNDFTAGTPNPRRTEPIVELGPWVSGTDPATNGSTVPKDASVTVDFSEPVNVDAGWYNITCNSSGLHNDVTVAHTNDFKTYAITPNTNFQYSEQCTVTVFKTAIHDQDTDDSGQDTDTLFADYIWSFTVVAAGQAAPYPPSVHLTLGDPGCGTLLGCAAANINQPNNYLMSKPTYALSYNRDKGTANWVSWHLDNSWYGTLARVDTFRPDPAVPSDWYRVQAFDYSGSGFDRGHMTPNADRDNQNRVPINQETYLMSNMVPQSPDNNQGPWADFEGYLRTLTDAGSEIYIVSGPNGVGGVGSASGNTVNTLANGHVTVPSATWKVALVLPSASGDDVSRATCGTRTIAVLMPNQQGIRNNPWTTYLTTVDAIEQLTGYDFFQNVPKAVQACIEAGTNGTNPPGTADQSVLAIKNTPENITLSALSSDTSAVFTYTVGNPSHGGLSGTAPNLTYTPAANYVGPDSFTFSVYDGHANSNTSTVNIAVVSQIQAGTADTTVTFVNPNQTGTTTFTPIDPASAGTVPMGYTLCPTCPAYNITTTVAYSPPVDVCLAVPAAINQADYLLMKLLHGEDGVLVDRTVAHFTGPGGQRWVCGSVNSLSPFALGEGITPTAADGAVTGVVADANGAPLAGVTINLMGGKLSSARLAITDASGNYHFDNLESNGFYTVTPSRPNYSFSPANRSFSLLGARTEASFSAVSNGDRLNALDTTPFFVRQQYLDFLNREPDEAGLNFWVNQIEVCGGDANCREAARVNTSAAFFLSIEFQQTGYEVYRLYRSAFGDLPKAPVPVRLSDFKADAREIGEGVIVNRTGWEQLLEQNQQQFAVEFAQRSRFVDAYPNTLTPDQFVDRLFGNAGVVPSLADRLAAISEFGVTLDTRDVQARARALRRVAENSMLVQQEFNRAFVLMQYFGYLGRDPNAAPDTNFDGYNFWLEKLDRFGGNYRDAEMVKAFMESSEYRRRFQE